MAQRRRDGSRARSFHTPPAASYDAIGLPTGLNMHLRTSTPPSASHRADHPTQLESRHLATFLDAFDYDGFPLKVQRPYKPLRNGNASANPAPSRHPLGYSEPISTQRQRLHATSLHTSQQSIQQADFIGRSGLSLVTSFEGLPYRLKRHFLKAVSHLQGLELLFRYGTSAAEQP